MELLLLFFFHGQIKSILLTLPKTGRQTLMFSATIPPKTEKLARDVLTNPLYISVGPVCMYEIDDFNYFFSLFVYYSAWCSLL